MKKVYIIAVFVALLAGVATYFFASQIEQKTTIKDEPTKDVVVAVMNIRENTVITAEMVQILNIPSRFVNVDAVGTLEEVVGKLARNQIMKDEQVLKSRFLTIGEDSKNTALSYQLLPGEYAYPVSVDTVQGVAGFISKGDLVDIVYTSSGGGQLETTFLLQNIRVIRISNFAINSQAEASGTKITTYTEVVLVLNAQQVIELTQAQNTGSIRLVLKPIVSEEEMVTNPDETTTEPEAESQPTETEETTAA